MSSTLVLTALISGSAEMSADEPNAVRPLRHAHAHNDYHHQRPLLDALERGFCSFEADVFLVKDKLLVGHNTIELRSERTLEKLYLDPLRQRARQFNGRIFPNGPTVTLLIDIKANSKAAYPVLQKLLSGYRELLSGQEDGQWRERAVQVVISGDRPIEQIIADKSRLVGIDGRLSDLNSQLSASLMPLISDRWTSHFRWRGEGEMPAPERDKLQSIVNRAHQSGRRVRFWATPEKTNVWRELLQAGVDHINTDELDSLQHFLLQQR